jgi:hypothetical protein
MYISIILDTMGFKVMMVMNSGVKRAMREYNRIG